MQRFAAVVEQVSAELDARAAFVIRLEAEAKAAEALPALHQEAAAAVQRMLDAELGRSERRIRCDSVVIGLLGLVFGAAVTFMVTLLVHPLH